MQKKWFGVESGFRIAVGSAWDHKYYSTFKKNGSKGNHFDLKCFYGKELPYMDRMVHIEKLLAVQDAGPPVFFFLQKLAFLDFWNMDIFENVMFSPNMRLAYRVLTSL